MSPRFFPFALVALFGLSVLIPACLDETGGIDTYQVRVSEVDGESVRIRLFFFDISTHSLVVVDQGDQPEKKPAYRGLREAMESHDCVAGANASYFHSDFRPLGLAVANGKRVNELENSNLLSGVVVSKDNGASLQILRRREFKDGKKVDQLVQAGPFLIDAGEVVEGLSSSKKASRTFLMTDGKGKFALGYTGSSVTLAGLALLLSDAKVVPEFEVSRALNLDGGSSSCFWVKTGEHQDSYFRNLKPVRNFIGIKERQKQRSVTPSAAD